MTGKRPHPSNIVHEATDYLDALTRHEAALRYEQPHLDAYDREHGTTTDRSSYEEAMSQARTSRVIWMTEWHDLQVAIDRLTAEAKQRAAAEMRSAGLDDVYADACESDDFGQLAI